MNTPTPPNPPTKINRVQRFIFSAIPGALIVGICGPVLVHVGTRGSNIWLCSFLGFAFLFGSALLLHGTGTNNEPLVLLIFAPVAILTPYGYQVDYWQGKIFTSPPFVGFITPIIAYPLISHYYRKRAMKAAAALNPGPSNDQ
jgi:hypothetical protein